MWVSQKFFPTSSSAETRKCGCPKSSLDVSERGCPKSSERKLVPPGNRGGKRWLKFLGEMEEGGGHALCLPLLAVGREPTQHGPVGRCEWSLVIHRELWEVSKTTLAR